nr:immunoglobulin heavy chain junction region [Mus musculus]
CSRGTMDYW